MFVHSIQQNALYANYTIVTYCYIPLFVLSYSISVE